MKKLNRLFAAGAALAVAATGFACKSATPYAAKVNGVTLTQSALEDELDAIRGNKDYLKALQDSGVPVNGTGENTSTFSTQFVARILTRRIYLELIHQELVRRKLTVTEADIDNAHQQLLQQIGDEKMLQKFPKAYLSEIERTTAEVTVLQNALADVSDKSLRAYYEDNIEQFETVCAAHILVAEKSEADAIVRQLNAARDKKAKFEELAKAESTDTGSGAQGGDLGCNSPSTYVEEFKDAVRTQTIGAIGAPVQTQFGYHVIRVDSREAAKPFEEVKDQVETAITDSQQGPFNEFLTKASTEAKVEVNPRYGTYDTTGQSPEVVPPKAPANSGAETQPGNLGN